MHTESNTTRAEGTAIHKALAQILGRGRGPVLRTPDPEPKVLFQRHTPHFCAALGAEPRGAIPTVHFVFAVESVILMLARWA
jgi:hypothetical protein